MYGSTIEQAAQAAQTAAQEPDEVVALINELRLEWGAGSSFLRLLVRFDVGTAGSLGASLGVDERQPTIGGGRQRYFLAGLASGGVAASARAVVIDVYGTPTGARARLRSGDILVAINGAAVFAPPRHSGRARDSTEVVRTMASRPLALTTLPSGPRITSVGTERTWNISLSSRTAACPCWS